MPSNREARPRSSLARRSTAKVGAKTRQSETNTRSPAASTWRGASAHFARALPSGAGSARRPEARTDAMKRWPVRDFSRSPHSTTSGPPPAPPAPALLARALRAAKLCTNSASSSKPGSTNGSWCRLRPRHEAPCSRPVAAAPPLPPKLRDKRGRRGVCPEAPPPSRLLQRLPPLRPLAVDVRLPAAAGVPAPGPSSMPSSPLPSESASVAVAAFAQASSRRNGRGRLTRGLVGGPPAERCFVPGGASGEARLEQRCSSCAIEVPCPTFGALPAAGRTVTVTGTETAEPSQKSADDMTRGAA
mmetsp:Transcript_160904/g.516410  ORF Transcript_160904/g.516410 Transcript_160904/m.516410 type:complete len:302 (-) Transcript_160904:191-1096(-)